MFGINGQSAFGGREGLLVGRRVVEDQCQQPVVVGITRVERNGLLGAAPCLGQVALAEERPGQVVVSAVQVGCGGHGLPCYGHGLLVLVLLAQGMGKKQQGLRIVGHHFELCPQFLLRFGGAGMPQQQQGPAQVRVLHHTHFMYLSISSYSPPSLAYRA